MLSLTNNWNDSSKLKIVNYETNAGYEKVFRS